MRAFLVVIVVVAACNEHDVMRAEIVKEDCSPCHTASKGQLPHPEAMFPIATGPHSTNDQGAPVQCIECHDFRTEPVNSGMAGVNANCTDTCHPRGESDPQHVGVTGYTWDDATKDFCLTCHPNGLLQ